MPDINKRVMKLIDILSVSRQDFAARIEIAVTVLSHISSGRNKPGLEMVQRILKEYPKVSADWLLLGTGKPYREEKQQVATKELEEKLYALGLIIKDQQQNTERKLKELSDLLKKA
ncbi:MAG: helix-turn-helix transcriptional regulator [Bacteroidia bacterium]|nr:helix-turn-helix transcriptional regulator [Bacteroidia bacterium]